MEIMQARHGAIPETEAEKMRQDALGEIDKNSLYIQLQEKLEVAIQRAKTAETALNESRRENSKLNDALFLLMKTKQDFTFRKYTDSRLAAQNEIRSFETKMGNSVMGLAGEVGEISEHVKKWFYHGKPLDKEHLIKELGDVLWYVMYMADAIGSSLETVAFENELKLNARYPNGFSVEAASQVGVDASLTAAFSTVTVGTAER